MNKMMSKLIYLISLSSVLLCIFLSKNVHSKTYSYAQLNWASVSGPSGTEDEQIDAVSGHFVLSNDVFKAQSSFTRTPMVLDLFSGANLDFYSFGDGEHDRLGHLLLDGGGQSFSAVQRHSTLFQIASDDFQMGIAYQVLRPQERGNVAGIDNTFDHSTTKVFLRGKTSRYFSFKLSYHLLFFGEQWYHDEWIDGESYSPLAFRPNVFREMLNIESWGRNELIGQVYITTPLTGLHAHTGLVQKSFEEQTVLSSENADDTDDNREDIFSFISLAYSNSHEIVGFQSSKLRLGYIARAAWENNHSNQASWNYGNLSENAYSFQRLRGDVTLNLTWSTWRLEFSGALAQKNYDDRPTFIGSSLDQEDTQSEGV